MKTNTSLPTLGAIALLLTGVPLAAHAQAPANVKQVPLGPVPTATAVFSSELGRAVVKPNPALSVTYSVTATEPATSKAVSQKLRFNVLEEGLRQVTDAAGQTGERQGTSSRYLTLNTGKYKNIGQLKGLLADVLRRFLAAGPTAAINADLGKVGDARYGGEIHFVVASADVLRCDYMPASQSQSGFQFTRRDAQAFLNILSGN